MNREGFFLFCRMFELFVLAWEGVPICASLLCLCCESEASPKGDTLEDFLEPSVLFVSWEELSCELCVSALRLFCWLLFWLPMEVVLGCSVALDRCVMEHVCMRSTLT